MRNITVARQSLLAVLLIGTALAQTSNPKGDENKEVKTELGYLRGKVEVIGKPQDVNVSANVIAAGEHGESASANIAPNQIYVIPLAPGTYQVHAEFGSAKSKLVPITIRNGKTEQQDFSFGKEEKQ